MFFGVPIYTYFAPDLGNGQSPFRITQGFDYLSTEDAVGNVFLPDETTGFDLCRRGLARQAPTTIECSFRRLHDSSRSERTHIPSRIIFCLHQGSKIHERCVPVCCVTSFPLHPPPPPPPPPPHGGGGRGTSKREQNKKD